MQACNQLSSQLSQHSVTRDYLEFLNMVAQPYYLSNEQFIQSN